MTDLADYLLDHYGTCGRSRGCLCREPGQEWLGRGCDWWLPAGVTTWTEYKSWTESVWTKGTEKGGNENRGEEISPKTPPNKSSSRS